MVKNQHVKPFVKWAGGKRQLLPEIKKYVPRQFETFYEPFVGGGAVLFDLQPEKYVINDINAEIVNVYRTIKRDAEKLIKKLKTFKNEADFYYKVRGMDREQGFEKLSPVDRAARIIYLNKTCFNGLFRVNRKGQFNVPFGKYKNPNIVNEETLLAVSQFFNQTQGEILNTDFEKALDGVNNQSFAYIDPPYDPLSYSSSFTGYSLNGFGRGEQERLKLVCDKLDKRGCKFLLSNSATDFIKDLYQDYNIKIVKAGRNINSVATKRGKIDEVLIRNY